MTEKIADYFTRTLLPMADLVVDIHAGGKTLDFVPFACVHRLADQEQEARCVAAMKAFSAPYSMMLREIDAVGMYDTEAENQGKTFVSTELGGGGSSTARSNAIAKRGITNVLIDAGILAGKVDRQPSVLLDMPSSDCFVFSDHQGLFEILADLGDTLTEGQPLARIWPTERTGSKPCLYASPMDGMLVGRHFPGLIKMGDCLAVVAVVAVPGG